MAPLSLSWKSHAALPFHSAQRSSHAGARCERRSFREPLRGGGEGGCSLSTSSSVEISTKQLWPNAKKPLTEPDSASPGLPSSGEEATELQQPFGNRQATSGELRESSARSQNKSWAGMSNWGLRWIEGAQPRGNGTPLCASPANSSQLTLLSRSSHSSAATKQALELIATNPARLQRPMDAGSACQGASCKS